MWNTFLNRVNPDSNPDGFGGGIDYEGLCGILLVAVLILFAITLLFYLKYISIKDKYNKLQSKTSTDAEEEHE